MVNLGGFRRVNGGRHKENLNRVLPGLMSLIVINGRWRDPPRAGPTSRLIRALQSMGAAVGHDREDRLLQHLDNLGWRVGAGGHAWGCFLCGHTSNQSVSKQVCVGIDTESMAPPTCPDLTDEYHEATRDTGHITITGTPAADDVAEHARNDLPAHGITLDAAGNITITGNTKIHPDI